MGVTIVEMGVEESQHLFLGCALNQSLCARPTHTQGRPFQPIAWVICHLWPENSLITCNSQIEAENARSLKEKC